MFTRALLVMASGVGLATGCFNPAAAPPITDDAAPGPDGMWACTGIGDCTDPGPCATVACEQHACVVTNLATGTALAAQANGDCSQQVCDGAGAVMAAVDDSDLPDDSNLCTDDVCTSGVPTNPFRPQGATCGELTCDGNGACTGCGQPSDCPGSDDECQTRTCTVGQCGVDFAAANTPLAAQSSGDCLTMVCDGAGQPTNMTDGNDVPVDGVECTDDVCQGAGPANPPVAAGTTCSQNGGAVCDGNNACVECTAPTDCAGQDTECQARTCNANTCGVSFTAANTPVSVQTAGDCQANVCDGTGAPVDMNDDADLPVDGNQCTSDICMAGVPSNPPASAGQPCSQGGGVQCDGAGICVP